jgi:hypothetical protein
MPSPTSAVASEADVTTGGPDLGAEVVRVAAQDNVSQLNAWIHDAYLHDDVRFDAEASHAIVPLLQEASALPGTDSAPPRLLRKTLFARHFEVPLTQCNLLVETARSLTMDVEWGDPLVLEAGFSDRTFYLLSGSAQRSVSIEVERLDVRLHVSSTVAGYLHRKVLRLFPAESDKWLQSP